MIMEFYFDEQKCDKAGYEKEECLNAIRRHFAKNNEYGTIKETSEGIFEATLDGFGTFVKALRFENDEWFRETVSGWYWTIPEMESGKERVDMIDLAKQHNAWN